MQRFFYTFYEFECSFGDENCDSQFLVIGFAHFSGLVAFGDVGGEAETALRILDDAAEVAPPLQHLGGGMLRLELPFLTE